MKLLLYQIFLIYNSDYNKRLILLQNFMAESMPPPLPPQHAQKSEVSAEQGYSSYPGQSSAMYMSTTTNPGVPTPPAASDYRPSYGNNYGY